MAEAESWLRKILTEIAVEQEYHDCKIELEPLSSGGANYSSQLFTATLSSVGKNDLKLFCKVATLGEKIRSMSEVQVFEIEIMFYTIMVPKFRKLEEKYNFPEGDRLVLPEYYGGSAEYLNEVLVLEDFCAKGYKAYDRFKCYDWEYASKCLSVLARLHALSVAFQADDPKGYSELFGNLKFTIPPEDMQQHVNRSIATAVNVTDEIHREKLEKFLRNDSKKQTFMKYFHPENRLLLSHGDFRPSNVLQADNDEGKLQVVLVDYQMIRPGNPVNDLLYFLITGSDEEFRKNHLHQYFNYYYEIFSKTLQLLGLTPDDVYSEMDYRNDVKEMLPFGLTFGMLTLPFITVEESEAPKPEDGVDADSFHLAGNDHFRDRFNGLVRDYVKFGIL